MSKENRYVIIGASRGLGRSIAHQFKSHCKDQFLFISRKVEPLKTLCQEHFQHNGQHFCFDCTQIDSLNILTDRLLQFDCTHIFYISGGGPHGKFADKKMKDHLWAYQLSLLFPAHLIHWALQTNLLKQLIVVGSSIAEDKPDALAASYASAKHGLKGLVTSLNEEGVGIDLRLFSPPYMRTDMLPLKLPQAIAEHVKNPDDIAKAFYEWSHDANGLKHWQF